MLYVISIWGIAFWVWAVLDATSISLKERSSYVQD
jgi:hypothetical protein